MPFKPGKWLKRKQGSKTGSSGSELKQESKVKKLSVELQAELLSKVLEGLSLEHDNQAESAISHYTQAHKKGYSAATFILGIQYYWGTWLLQDKALGQQYIDENKLEGISLLKAYAEKNDPQAEFYLAYIYLLGLGVEKDSQQAFQWMSKCANQGNLPGQNILGYMFSMGVGVEQNQVKAMEWIRQSAEQGFKGAQCNMGWGYENGKGVEQSYAKALEWYTKSAKQGYRDAQNALGFLYESGRGVTRNYTKAYEWYLKSAEQGFVVAQANLGGLYERGQGVEQNYSKARRWYLKAVDQGNVTAQNNVATMYFNGNGVQQNYSEAMKLFRLSAEQGDSDAQYCIGVMYVNGHGVELDYNEAHKWYLKAADQGHSDAQFNLGVMYEEGQGIRQDNVEALKFFRKAAAQGDVEAKSKVKKLEAKLAPKAKSQVSASVPAKKETSTNLTYKKLQVIEDDAEKNKSLQADKKQPPRQGLLNSISSLQPSDDNTIKPSSAGSAKFQLNSKSPPSAPSLPGANIGGSQRPTEKLVSTFNKNSISANESISQGTSVSANTPLNSNEASPQPQSTHSSSMLNAGRMEVNLEVLAGDIRLGKAISSGGFGTVYKGYHHGRKVAIKQLHIREMTEAALREFQQEASMMMRLQSPSVVTLYGVTLKPPYYLVMEYMNGGSLHHLLQSQVALDWKRRSKIAREISQGLSFLHSRNILHRDLKSMNVLLDKLHRVKLGDFGLAKVKQESSSQQTQQSVGTTAWMAPELFKRRAVYSQASDIYGLGMLLWEIASRKLPFSDAPNPAVVMGWVMQGEREDIPVETPRWYADLITACWDAEPSRRPDITEVVQRLEAGFAEEKMKVAGTAEKPSVANPTGVPSITSGQVPSNEVNISGGYISGIQGAYFSGSDMEPSMYDSGTNSAVSGRVSDSGIFGAYVSQAVNIPSDEEADSGYHSPRFS